MDRSGTLFWAWFWISVCRTGFASESPLFGKSGVITWAGVRQSHAICFSSNLERGWESVILNSLSMSFGLSIPRPRNDIAGPIHASPAPSFRRPGCYHTPWALLFGHASGGMHQSKAQALMLERRSMEDVVERRVVLKGPQLQWD